jgi:uncharacterized protein YecT (DUF1311 family)
MKITLVVIVFAALLIFAAALAAGQKDASTNSTSTRLPEPVCGQANTQMEINQCFDTAYQKADKELNELYSELMKKRDASTRERLQAVQRLWIKYRDAHSEAAAALYQGGSIQPSIRSGCLERVTRYRIDEIRHDYSFDR